MSSSSSSSFCPSRLPVFLPLVTDIPEAHRRTSPTTTSSFTNPSDEDVSSSFTNNDSSPSSFTSSTPQYGCAAPQDSCTCITDDLNNIETTIRILDILESFGTHITKDPRQQGKWIGKPKFLHHVISRVRKDEPIQLTMPAFPCKSVRSGTAACAITDFFVQCVLTLTQANRENKVLGHLPDLGEELGLSRLNDIAVAISEVYEHGATVNIASDGILFNGMFLFASNFPRKKITLVAKKKMLTVD